MTRLEELCSEFDNTLAGAMGNAASRHAAFLAFGKKLQEEGFAPKRELPAIVKQILAEAEDKS